MGKRPLSLINRKSRGFCLDRKEKKLKILAIGDVTSPEGIRHLEEVLWRYRERAGIDFCVVNGENASFISGISEPLAKRLLSAGADCITGGNHTLYNKSVYTYLDDTREILRPINFSGKVPGHGAAVLEAKNGYRVLVISAMGTVHIEPRLNSPYEYIDRALNDYSGKYDFSVLDIHAEATGEKLAIGYAYDGKINVIFGTHTHVPTADEQILPHGTGYVTDVGMCGNSGGILGMEPRSVIERMRNQIPEKFVSADGAVRADGVVFTLDTGTGRVTHTERVRL